MNKRLTRGLALIVTLSMLFGTSSMIGAEGWMTKEELRSNLRHDIPIEWITKDYGTVDQSIRVIVELKPGTNLKRVESQVLAYEGAKIRNEYDVVFSGFSAEIPYLNLPLIYQIPGVAKVTKTTEYFETMASSKILTQSLEAANEFSNNGEGVVVSIIDSGIDVEHRALSRLDNPAKAKIKEADIKPFGGDNTDTRFNIKVPYGYNFADHSYYVKGLESNHGVHVAGIVGANDDDDKVALKQGIDGVASQVQLLAMKVFSNDPNAGGAQDDDIIAAIEASIEHKADIINLSLGTQAGFMNPENPMQRAINAAAEKGVFVVAAAGNEAAAFSESANSKQVQNFFNRKDIGLVGSPSTASGALSVASYENTNKFVYHIVFNGNNSQETRLVYTYTQGALPVGQVKMVNVGKGELTDYTEDVKRQVSGNIAFVERGKLTFVDKLNNAKANGAVGMVVYNNVPQEEFNMSLTGTDPDFFAASLIRENGLQILAALEQNADTAFEFDPQARSVENDGKDQMSAFTSWGTTGSLDFKPEISGVGGQVYSTDNDNKYVMMSGTSMASPHVAGASAIILSQIKKDLPNLDNYVTFIKKTMMNTAKIIMPVNSDIPYSPRRQGAGLVQTKDAITNRVLATFTDKNGLAAGELRSFTGSKTFDVYLHNYGENPVTFRVDPGKVYTTVTENNLVKEALSSATIATSRSEVTLPAGQGVTLNFTLDASSVDNDFVEGFIKFESQTPNQPNIHFTYMGFAGDWNKESIFDLPDFTENEGQTIYSDTQLVSMVKNPLDIFDQGKIFPLGVPFGSDDKKVNPTASKIAISPNGDGFADIALPQIGMLRSAKNMEINILDANKEVVKHLYELSGVRRQSYHSYIDRLQKQQKFVTYPYPEGLWDGTVYNQKTGKNEILPDGQYYMQIKARLSEEYEYQELLFPIKLDTKSPKITVVQSEGKDYKITENGREITFKVVDDTAIGVVYAKVNGVRTEATKIDDDTYQVIIPFGNNVSDKVDIFANDTALNQSTKIIKNVGGNSLRLVDWQSYVTNKRPVYINGTTELADAATIAFEFVAKKEPHAVTTGNDNRIRNGRFNFVSLQMPDEGKYRAYAIEKNAGGDVIKRTDLGDFVFDWHRPYLKKFKRAGVIREKAEQKNPLGNTSKKYVEYIIQKNADGSATYEGTVYDNVFDPQELTVTIGGRGNRPKINPDGTFKYILKHPSVHFDFVNVYQPTSLNPEEQTDSSTIDGLDLATDPNAGNKKKRLETTYVVSKYLPYAGPVEPKEFKLTLSKTHVLGKASLDPKEPYPVIQRDDKYYFKIDGYTTQPDNKVFIAGQAADINITTDNGTHFSKEVEIHEGANNINVRVLSAADEMLADVKVRVLFDMNLPTLELKKPEQDLLTEGKWENDKQEEEDVLFVDTYEDDLTFAGNIKDAGFGYLLKINDEFVVDLNGNSYVAGSSEYGENRKEFTKVIKVEDQDILTLYMEDSNGNRFTQKYIVRKLEKPVINIVNENDQGALVGINVNILNEEGEIVASYVSGEQPQNLALKPGTYTYQETSAINGYAKASEVKFVVAKDGSLSFPNAPSGFTATANGFKVVAPVADNSSNDSGSAGNFFPSYGDQDDDQDDDDGSVSFPFNPVVSEDNQASETNEQANSVKQDAGGIKAKSDQPSNSASATNSNGTPATAADSKKDKTTDKPDKNKVSLDKSRVDGTKNKASKAGGDKSSTQMSRGGKMVETTTNSTELGKVDEDKPLGRLFLPLIIGLLLLASFGGFFLILKSRRRNDSNR